MPPSVPRLGRGLDSEALRPRYLYCRDPGLNQELAERLVLEASSGLEGALEAGLDTKVDSICFGLHGAHCTPDVRHSATENCLIISTMLVLTSAHIVRTIHA